MEATKKLHVYNNNNIYTELPKRQAKGKTNVLYGVVSSLVFSEERERNNN